MDNNAKLSNAAMSVMSTWVERPNELKERLFYQLLPYFGYDGVDKLIEETKKAEEFLRG